jgi:hypothetical protein
MKRKIKASNTPALLPIVMLLAPQVMLVTSQEEFIAGCRAVQCDVPPFCFCGPENAAKTNRVYDANGHPSYFVGVGEYLLTHEDGIYVASMLVHEAVHVWQRFSEFLSENDDAFGRESEAYAIESISRELMHEFARAKQARDGS